MARASRLASANNAFQRVEALRRNRTLRHRYREVFVEGVRPINLALEHGWRFKSLWFGDGRRLSSWAAGVIGRLPQADTYALSAELMAQLSERDEPSELVAVLEMRTSRLAEIASQHDTLIVVADRPGNPGNLGTIIRSCDALGAHAVLISGHAADPFDPQAIRASMGSVFALPIVEVGGAADVAGFVAGKGGLQVVGTDSDADESIDDVDLSRPTVLILGNEGKGLSYAYRQLCDRIARIPLIGAADSLNVAAAASIVLYEASRQRRSSPPATTPAPRGRAAAPARQASSD